MAPPGYSSARSRANAFGTLELDRASEHRENAALLTDLAQAPTSRYVLLGPDGRALVSADRRGLRALDGAMRAELALDGDATFLGSANGNHYFMLSPAAADVERGAAANGDVLLDLRSAGATLAACDAGLFAYARGIAHWQARTRFCTHCGAPLSLEHGGHRARCTNADCGLEHFPRTDPAIIVIVNHQGRCLLGRGPQWPKGRYSTLAGFVEPGETLEDAVRREVFEESGVRVGECDYHSSQPWPFPASLMLGFTAEAEDPSIRLGAALAAVRWFSVDELLDGLRNGTLGLSSPLSVSYRLIEQWLRQTAGLELSSRTRDDPLFGQRR